MKKKITALLCILLSLSLFSALCGCGGDKAVSEKDDALTLVCVGFPEYDWARNILGDNPGNVSLSLIIDNGADPHSYQATVQDIAEISSCDLLVHTGGVSDQWVADALKASAEESLTEINMLSFLADRLVEEELVEGMEAEEEEHEAEEDPEPDEHVWLSLRNAAMVCEDICEKLSALDADNAETYRANCDEYLAELDRLDGEFAAFLENTPLKTILLADRFPFRYLAEDYGIDYYAAFAGCSSETSASFETVLFLADKRSELDLPAVLILDGSDGEIAKAVLQNSVGGEDCEILTMDSLQSITREQIDGGKTYLSVMENNLSVLRQALGAEK